MAGDSSAGFLWCREFSAVRGAGLSGRALLVVRGGRGFFGRALWWFRCGGLRRAPSLFLERLSSLSCRRREFRQLLSPPSFSFSFSSRRKQKRYIPPGMYPFSHLQEEPLANLGASLVRYGQLLATFGTSCCQHLAAVGGRHSLAESVFVDSLPLVRLKSSFHCHISIPFICLQL